MITIQFNLKFNQLSKPRIKLKLKCRFLTSFHLLQILRKISLSLRVIKRKRLISRILRLRKNLIFPLNTEKSVLKEREVKQKPILNRTRKRIFRLDTITCLPITTKYVNREVSLANNLLLIVLSHK